MKYLILTDEEAQWLLHDFVPHQVKEKVCVPFNKRVSPHYAKLEESLHIGDDYECAVGEVHDVIAYHCQDLVKPPIPILSLEAEMGDPNVKANDRQYSKFSDQVYPAIIEIALVTAGLRLKE